MDKAYYAVIPANVRYDKDLPHGAKLLYGEITALCNAEGRCWASNKYFSDLYGVSQRSISGWIKTLIDCGYITSQIVYKSDSKEVDMRYIYIASPMEKNCDTPMEKNFQGYGKNFQGGMEKNFQENITTLNTTSNINNLSKKKDKRKSEFDEVLADVDEGLRDLIFEYIKMRKSIKAPMTDRAVSMLLNKIRQLEPDDIERQKKLVENAIINNWKSVYPLKDVPKKPNYYPYEESKLPEEDDIARLKRLMEEMKG